MTSPPEVEAYVKAKGACHYKELAAWFDIEPADAAAMLGSLMANGRVAAPWATMQGPFVWYRHVDVPFNRSAGTMRNVSRTEHPEVWPVKHAKRRERRHVSSGRPTRLEAGEKRNELVMTYLKRYGPATLAEIEQGAHVARTTARRAITDLETAGKVYRADHVSNGNVGRPQILWGVVDSAVPVSLGDTSGEDDDDWRRVVQVVEE